MLPQLVRMLVTTKSKAFRVSPLKNHIFNNIITKDASLYFIYPKRLLTIQLPHQRGILYFVRSLIATPGWHKVARAFLKVRKSSMDFLESLVI